MFIWYFNCLQDTLTLPTLVNITFANARIGLLRLQSFGPLWTISTGNQWEISEVGHLSCFINFCLFDFTLFMIDIHQIMLISLFPTPLDHFHFHGSGGLILWYDFRLWHMCCFYWPMLQEKHHLQLKFQKKYYETALWAACDLCVWWWGLWGQFYIEDHNKHNSFKMGSFLSLLKDY